MAFTIKNTKNVNNSELKNENTISFLDPKKDVIKDSCNDEQKKESLIMNAKNHTAKTLNALKIISPVISALMINPGINASKNDISEKFQEIIKEVSEKSGLICEKIGVDIEKPENFWIRNVIEKNLAEICSNQLINTNNIDLSFVVDNIEIICNYAETTFEDKKYENLPNLEMLKIAQVKAMSHILNVIRNNFDMFRNLDDDIPIIMEKLFNSTIYGINKLSDDYASSKDKSQLFNVLINEASKVFATSWEIEAKKSKLIIEGQPQEKAAQIKEKYEIRGGLPIKKIEEDFDRYYQKMLAISEKLVLSQSGSMEKRLKK